MKAKNLSLYPLDRDTKLMFQFWPKDKNSKQQYQFSKKKWETRQFYLLFYDSTLLALGSCIGFLKLWVIRKYSLQVKIAYP